MVDRVRMIVIAYLGKLIILALSLPLSFAQSAVILQVVIRYSEVPLFRRLGLVGLGLV